MLALILFLIIVWIVLALIGVAVHGLVWVTVLAVVAFLATLVFRGTRISAHRRG